ncbi:MAG: hypothetical protein AAF497_28235, partial [Planctomycetota bacterium]
MPCNPDNEIPLKRGGFSAILLANERITNKRIREKCMHRARLTSVLLCLVAASCVTAQEKFSQIVGAVRPQAVQNKQPIE